MSVPANRTSCQAASRATEAWNAARIFWQAFRSYLLPHTLLRPLTSASAACDFNCIFALARFLDPELRRARDVYFSAAHDLPLPLQVLEQLHSLFLPNIEFTGPFPLVRLEGLRFYRPQPLIPKFKLPLRSPCRLMGLAE